MLVNVLAATRWNRAPTELIGSARVGLDTASKNVIMMTCPRSTTS